jgi:hypothetical protein
VSSIGEIHIHQENVQVARVLKSQQQEPDLARMAEPGVFVSSPWTAATTNTVLPAVADLEKFRSGDKSTDWGHSLYKFAKSKEFIFKYKQIL